MPDETARRLEREGEGGRWTCSMLRKGEQWLRAAEWRLGWLGWLKGAWQQQSLDLQHAEKRQAVAESSWLKSVWFRAQRLSTFLTQTKIRAYTQTRQTPRAVPRWLTGPRLRATPRCATA